MLRAPTELARCAAVLVLMGAIPATIRAQQAAPEAAPLVFDGVTVVDVEHGTLLADQRVVIAGRRIDTVGSSRAIAIPRGAQVVDAKGKYLIPGLWDMHTHLAKIDHDQHDVLVSLNYKLLLANGITGLRDGNSPQVPLDTFKQWRREILAGTRVGPPRQLFSAKIDEQTLGCDHGNTYCIADLAEARPLVDSVAKAGADMLKMYALSPAMYFAIAAEARRVGLPFGGHVGHPPEASEASDSGARIVDHIGSLPKHCWASQGSSDVNLDPCRRTAEQFRRNHTWWTPTMVAGPIVRLIMEGGTPEPHTIVGRLYQFATEFWTDSVFRRGWLRELPPTASGMQTPLDFSITERAGVPLLAGTDVTGARMSRPPFISGFSLHAELAMLVKGGFSPWRVLQAATLNPAMMLHATDSLGTVAGGKLADLVLLDANPLDDITNTTLIRAVVANGRYFDRAALDRLLAEVRVEGGMVP